MKVNFENYLRKVIVDIKLQSHVSEICDSFHFLELNKDDFLVQEGKVCKYFCYINDGVLQHSIDVLGEEKTTYLAMKNSCTSALKSFLQKIPSRKYIRALSDCKLLAVDLNTFNRLLKSNKAFNTFYYNLIENQIFLIDDYRIDLLTLSPEDRYKKLLANEPNLLQKVPLHYLSSFLGISTRHMSRIRRDIK